jgi:hypothetical protein
VLGATVGVTCYALLGPRRAPPLTARTTGVPSTQTLAIDPDRRAATFLLVVSISALLVVMFALGAYLVVRYGQRLARQQVGGRPTAYVDAWGHYRLTDEQISAATAEGPPDAKDGSEGGGSPPDGPPPDEPPPRSPM